jgi:hypothetical protein
MILLGARMSAKQSASRLAVLLVDHELSSGGVAGLPRVYDKTFAELAPVIGARGVRGIFSRAFDIVQAEHAALRSFVVDEEPSAAASPLATCLSHATNDAARAAAVALYSAFIGLIVTFVGLELTVRLLRVAWPEVDFKEPQ